MRSPVFFFLLLSGAVTAQDVGPGPAAIAALRTRLVAPKADPSLLKLYKMQVQLADRALTEAPRPIDTIRTEGLLQGDPKKTATNIALRDMRTIYALALVYKTSGDVKYFPVLVRYLTAWAATNRPRGDPIDDTNLDPVIEAYDMVKQELSPAEAATVRAWLKVVGEIAFALGDTALEGYTVRGLRQQIGRNLNADGTSSDFIARDALHYHVYDLEPLLKLAILLKRATGANYYIYVSPTGSSIQKSVAWLLPYLNGEKTHGEFVHSTVEFDRRRAQNGEAAYKAGTPFDPGNGIATLVLAAYFDPDLLALARSLSGISDQYPSWQAVVDRL